ncbi:MAG: alanine racemase [Candidatus Limnocylindrales bacterium]
MTESIDQRLSAAGLPPLPRRVWLEIDEDALAGNLRIVREMAGAGVEVNAVVKADAYGHGLAPVGRAFEAAGADRLCVASLDEALALREAGVAIPILVLFAIPPGEVARAAANDVEIVAADLPGTAETLDRWVANAGDGELVVHVEVETGLTRGGVMPGDVPALIGRLNATPRVRTGGLWTHIAAAENESVTTAQVAEFDRAAALVTEAGLPLPRRHLAATGGFFTGRTPAYEGVRIGLALYGLLPADLPMPERERAFAERLRAAMGLKCRALRIERFPPGVGVSYGGRWRTERDSVIATLPAGYADAIPRPAPWGSVLIRGQRAPLVGTVAMDAVMADVTDVSGVRLDDEFVLLGSQGEQDISTGELAQARNTIPWEVATGMSYRIPRVYHAGSVLVGLRTLNAETRVSNTGQSTKGDRNR